MRWLKSLVLALLLCLPGTAAFAGIGGEIGATFPVGGGGSSSSAGALENYAALAGEALTVEAALREDEGELYLELRLVNPSDTPYSIEHRSGQSYDFALFDDSGKELWRWSNGMAFTQALTSETIPAKGQVAYTAQIAKKDYKKLKDKAELVRMYVTDTPYVLMLKVPKKHMSGSSTPVTLHGSIGIGTGGGCHGW